MPIHTLLFQVYWEVLIFNIGYSTKLWQRIMWVLFHLGYKGWTIPYILTNKAAKSKESKVEFIKTVDRDGQTRVGIYYTMCMCLGPPLINIWPLKLYQILQWTIKVGNIVILAWSTLNIWFSVTHMFHHRPS